MFVLEVLSLSIVEKSFAELSVEMGGFYILFASIFTAIFFSADISSGFIKNYAGSVSKRKNIIVSRIAMIALQNVLTLAVMFVSLCALAVFKGITIEISRTLGKYYICMFLAGLACSFLSMMYTELTRKSVSAIILTLAVTSGLVSQLAGTISGLISDGRFIISKYMVTGRFNQLGMESAGKEFNIVMVISFCYIIFCVVISMIGVEKRDVE